MDNHGIIIADSAHRHPCRRCLEYRHSDTENGDAAMHTTCSASTPLQLRYAFRRWQHAVLLFMMLILCSCGAPPQNLSFTTMTSDNDFTPRGVYGKEAPALMVIASPQD